MTTTILLAGASGDLGQRVARELLARGAEVRALTRTDSTSTPPPGTTVVRADYAHAAALQEACTGVDVVVSTLAGLRDVVVDAQTQLLDAAVAAGVPRFVPSDYAADFRRLPAGTNRNLELRREFAARVDAAPVRATSVLNGAFADMLTGQAPLVLFDRGRVLFWGSADQPLDFTTKDDVAAFTADAALDDDAPRWLQVAGETVTARSLAETMTGLTGRTFRPTFAGPVPLLRLMARVGRTFGDEDALYPAWQGMQYFDSMFSGDGTLLGDDRDRYGRRPWTGVREVLAAR
ncbi:NmrA family NAD(P)-binding protein [Modestobacter sp. Leaf380]|uniref:NmrA family NAD(P)-binding protein n=1 Tax=Modestobacter sp. Leaf380 TaxID=1736356 RepID=UPI0006FD3C29|nr:NmrA family NAD(P)-binding protein [Modestobacter sp. Leaf380]KQS69149.1 NmrA family protein [Modestobacter sp. Leaf380]